MIVLYNQYSFIFIYMFVFVGGLSYFLHIHMQSSKLKKKERKRESNVGGIEGGKEGNYILILLTIIHILETYLNIKKRGDGRSL